MKPIRVIIADDHPLLRSGVRNMLQREADVDVVAEATTGAEALQLARSLRPDVLVLDMEMPELSGLEVARSIRQESLPVRVLALSAYDDESYVDGLIEHGASGYITKDKPLPLILEAVRAVARGEGRWFVQPPTVERKASPLSQREEDVLRLMAQGLSNAEIADQLYIAERTVKNHITRIYTKLEVGSWREAVAWAWLHGLMA